MIDHSLVTGFTMFIRRSFDMTCFGISTYHRHEPPLSRKAARSDSATPSKLSNPGNHCWFNAIAQSLAATIATARTPSCSCSVMPDTHVERVLTILCQHGHVPSELKEAAIKDVVVERSKVEKARGRRGFVGHLLSASGFGRKFGTDFTEHAQDIDLNISLSISTLHSLLKLAN